MNTVEELRYILFIHISITLYFLIITFYNFKTLLIYQRKTWRFLPAIKSSQWLTDLFMNQVLWGSGNTDGISLTLSLLLFLLQAELTSFSGKMRRDRLERERNTYLARKWTHKQHTCSAWLGPTFRHMYYLSLSLSQASISSFFNFYYWWGMYMVVVVGVV